jgi:chemotaxis protein CheD
VTKSIGDRQSAHARAPARRETTIHVIQGEHRVTGDELTVYATILGSCVAACIFDPFARVGGMNHFLLPGDGHRAREADQYGAHLMELLVNDLMHIGARRDRLQAKLFGGARIVRSLSDVGRQNVEFAERFLDRDGIAIVGRDFGGERARRLQFWPASGRARQIYVVRDQSFAREEVEKASVEQSGGDLELF